MSTTTERALIALNLGCGSRTSSRCVNIDWSVMLRLHTSPIGRRIAPALLKNERWETYSSMAGDLVSHDLRRGIPYDQQSVDIVYHSHVMEHIDREAIPGFLAEVRRVLRPGGVQRIVVPDFEYRVRRYVASLNSVDQGSADPADHDEYVSELIEQSVRREAAGTAHQRRGRRSLENLLLGDARKRGETHQWMWDRVNITVELTNAGFEDVSILDFKTSSIEDWAGYGLDNEPDGREYKPGSLYVECRR